jgi:hypothetical protein
VHGIFGWIFGLVLALGICRKDLATHVNFPSSSVVVFIIVPIICAFAAAYYNDDFWSNIGSCSLDFQKTYLIGLGIGVFILLCIIGYWGLIQK